MFFDIIFYASLAIFIIGTGYQIVSWTKKSVEYKTQPPSSNRFSDMANAFFSTLFSRNSRYLIQSFLFDVLFQKRILKTSLLRWVMHFLIFTGFTALLFMHALDSIITEKLFPYYYPTVNPFFFLRDLFAAMVLAGIGIAVVRRYFKTPARMKNARADLVAIILIFIIIFSGILLEGSKMASVSEFTLMIEDYAGMAYEDEETLALETYWVKEFALSSPRVKPPFEDATLELGKEVHETNCMDCHSPNTAAFMGYTVAKLISPFAAFLESINGVSIFYYFHIIACFVGLALVPFTKLFHMVATPLNLMTRAVGEKTMLDHKTLLTRQVMALDACTHCSTCNLNCSAGMMYEAVQNEYILPSEKLQALKKFSAPPPLSSGEFNALFQGLYLCTNCNRCTVVCPSGIDLKSLWINVRENLIQQNPVTPFILSGFSFVRGLNSENITMAAYQTPLKEAFDTTLKALPETTPLALAIPSGNSGFTRGLPSTSTFSLCFGCQNCSTICPVVTNFETPEDMLTLLPHQIMYCLGLGLVDMAKGSAMIWNCLSCYQCQEHCPQNVSVCDILFQLKNKAFQDIDP